MSPVAKNFRVLVGVRLRRSLRVGAIVQVLKECVHPVLFISADGIFERSLS